MPHPWRRLAIAGNSAVLVLLVLVLLHGPLLMDSGPLCSQVQAVCQQPYLRSPCVTPSRCRGSCWGCSTPQCLSQLCQLAASPQGSPLRPWDRPSLPPGCSLCRALTRSMVLWRSARFCGSVVKPATAFSAALLPSGSQTPGRPCAGHHTTRRHPGRNEQEAASPALPQASRQAGLWHK